MGKYLLKANYTKEGYAGLRKEGAASRAKTVGELIKASGGSLEIFYYAFGDTDAYVVCDLPSNKVAAALATTITASGAVSLSTTVLLTPEEIDESLAVKVDYRPPGA